MTDYLARMACLANLGVLDNQERLVMLRFSLSQVLQRLGRRVVKVVRVEVEGMAAMASLRMEVVVLADSAVTREERVGRHRHRLRTALEQPSEVGEDMVDSEATEATALVKVWEAVEAMEETVGLGEMHMWTAGDLVEFEAWADSGEFVGTQETVALRAARTAPMASGEMMETLTLYPDRAHEQSAEEQLSSRLEPSRPRSRDRVPRLLANRRGFRRRNNRP